MDNGTVFTLIIIAIVALMIVLNFFVLRKYKRDMDKIDDQWNAFLEAVDREDVDKIQLYGDKLIWNTDLKQEQLSTIKEVVELHLEDNPALEQLKLDAFNKQLHYDRNIPSPGSSGGKPQSWSS